MKNGTYYGYIFHVENQNKRFDSIRLTLTDSIIEIDIPHQDFGSQSKSIILGTFTGLGRVTLINCSFVFGETGIGGKVVRFQSEHIISNFHITDLNKAYFKSSSTFLDSLFRWINKR